MKFPYVEYNSTECDLDIESRYHFFWQQKDQARVLESCRLADAEDYRKWLLAYIDSGGKVTRISDKSWQDEQRGYYVNQRNQFLPQLFGAYAIKILDPDAKLMLGTKSGTNLIGHSSVFGFSYANRKPYILPNDAGVVAYPDILPEFFSAASVNELVQKLLPICRDAYTLLRFAYPIGVNGLSETEHQQYDRFLYEIASQLVSKPSRGFFKRSPTLSIDLSDSVPLNNILSYWQNMQSLSFESTSIEDLRSHRNKILEDYGATALDFDLKIKAPAFFDVAFKPTQQFLELLVSLQDIFFILNSTISPESFKDIQEKLNSADTALKHAKDEAIKIGINYYTQLPNGITLLQRHTNAIYLGNKASDSAVTPEECVSYDEKSKELMDSIISDLTGTLTPDTIAKLIAEGNTPQTIWQQLNSGFKPAIEQ